MNSSNGHVGRKFRPGFPGLEIQKGDDLMPSFQGSTVSKKGGEAVVLSLPFER